MLIVTDAWELRKLGEVVSKEIKGKAKANMIGGKNYYLETKYLNGSNPILVDSPKDVEKDDILILWDGSQAGKVYHGFKGALGSTLKAYRPKESGEFIYQYLTRYQEKIYSSYRTPNIPHVVKSFKDEFTIIKPLIKEQEKIGTFFKRLDELITLHQRRYIILNPNSNCYNIYCTSLSLAT